MADANEEIEEIEKKNTKNLTQVRDMELKSNADHQLTKNKLTEIANEIEQIIS